MKNSVIIICGGGPAPGINAVIATVAKSFLSDGYRVLGIQHGYKGLFSDSPEIKEFDFEHADRITSRGGSTLIMSRFKPTEADFNTKIFEKENVKLLVTIGGDDTASTANRISKFLESKKIKIANIHVPKTIDNDLPLPNRDPTFGFHSAKDEGVRIGNSIYEDARTARQWFVMSAMGRSAGHLAFGIATACHYPIMIIPEMFSKTKISLEKIINLVISSIVKRKIMGIEYGVAMVSEGVFHILDLQEIESAGIHLTYDEHGHPELGNISKAHIFNVLLQRKLKELNLTVRSRPVELGYELRCARPIGFDLTLCSLLGLGVKKLFYEGVSGCIVSANSAGDITPLYLSDFELDGKIPPRLVETDSQMAKLFFNNMHYISEEDYQEASSFLDDPSLYDFNKILNW